MSYLVNKLAEQAGELVADKIKSALGGDDNKGKKNKKDKDQHGGFLSIFHHDKKNKKEDEHEGGLFSFGKDKKNRDDDGRDGGKVPRKSGFTGLFSEPERDGYEDEDGATAGPPTYEPPGDMGDGDGYEDGATAGPPTYEPPGDMGEGDLDLMNDLMEVANEMT